MFWQQLSASDRDTILPPGEHGWVTACCSVGDDMLSRSKAALAEEREGGSGDRLMVTIFLSSITVAMTVIIGAGGQLLGLW